MAVPGRVLYDRATDPVAANCFVGRVEFSRDPTAGRSECRVSFVDPTYEALTDFVRTSGFRDPNGTNSPAYA